MASSIKSTSAPIHGKNVIAEGFSLNSKRRNDDFYERVYDLVKQIPFGRVSTYGLIAEALGAKSSARMVGWALNAVSLSDRQDEIPCHRVVNRLGELSGKLHFETPTFMREMLEAEDVEFTGDAVNLAKHLWKPAFRE
jgi:methylated-DNA-protein-cysteine methyltransferase related protein